MRVVVGREEMRGGRAVPERSVGAMGEVGGEVMWVVRVGGRRRAVTTVPAVGSSVGAVGVGGVMVAVVGGVAHVVRAFFAVFPLLGEVGLTTAFPALVALGRVEFLGEGRELEEFLAAFAPLEVDLGVGVLPGRLITLLADVLVLPGDHAGLPWGQPAHDTAHVILVLGTGEVDQLLVHGCLLLVQRRISRDGGDLVRLVLVQDFPGRRQATTLPHSDRSTTTPATVPAAAAAPRVQDRRHGRRGVAGARTTRDRRRQGGRGREALAQVVGATEVAGRGVVARREGREGTTSVRGRRHVGEDEGDLLLVTSSTARVVVLGAASCHGYYREGVEETGGRGWRKVEARRVRWQAHTKATRVKS